MEINYNSSAALRAFLDENGLGMRKKFGQNFLLNPGVREALVDVLAAGAGETVWEVGPGLGAMTSLLLEKGLSVRAFEIDEGFAQALRKLFSGNAGLTLVEGDVLKTWASQPPSPYLLGNLPYNIAAALMADFVEQGRFFNRIVVTVQREVARRMAAGPGSADYSSFSVLLASVYRVKPLMVIKSGSFYPKPNVDSQAVLLELKDSVAMDNHKPPACFYPLVRQLFSSRRKTIKNNLTVFFTSQGKPAALVAAALEACAARYASIDGGRRAEDLSLDNFLALAQAIEDVG